MSPLAPTLQAFFTDRLIRQRNASPRTVTAYRDTFRLLLQFAQDTSGTAPTSLDVADIDAPLIAAFLNHLETSRGNSIATRNARLAAIHSLFRFAAMRHPEHVAVIARVLDIPPKRTDRPTTRYLTDEEIEALLAAPDRTTWLGRRDHALIDIAVQTGLRVSELTALRCGDVHTGPGAYVRCLGKGRKERAVPLGRQTVDVLRAWQHERRGESADPLIPNRTGGRLSTDAVEWLLHKHAVTAARTCPSMLSKTVTPHVLRHSCAMRLRASGVDISVIALWLGHESIESTQIYLHADMAIKERALARATPLGSPPGRYRPTDELLAFLDKL